MNIFITGATGFVGGELLVNLSKREGIDKIYCFIRASSEEEALSKVEIIFSIHDDFFDRKKIIPVLGNLFDDNLTDALIANKQIADTNVIIHSAANTSFSKIYDDMVEKANIGGLEKILLWAKQLSDLQTFLYIGTATICGKDIKNRIVFEDESPNLEANHLVKYTYTKMQGELLLHKHLPENKILIARPSIIMGDSRPLVPRSPVILWAIATINHLRFITVNENANLDVIPVDYAAEAIISLLFAKNRKHNVYHISSGATSSTTSKKITACLESYFTERPPFHFVNKSLLNQVKLWSKSKLLPSSSLYSYPEYLDYWDKTFADPSALRIILAGLEPYIEFAELGQIFDNSRLLNDVPAIKQSPPADVYIKNLMNFIEKIDIMEGAINP
ncbi:MAG: SDR family oxidoreductase [Bacteroidia bacterium]